jgi:hypothetical protein
MKSALPHLVRVQALAAWVPRVLAERAEHIQAVAALRAVVLVLNAHRLTARTVHHILRAAAAPGVMFF